MSALRTLVRRRWSEWTVILFFVVLAAVAIFAPLVCTSLSKIEYAPAFNAALSIGTSGIVAFIFYYVVTERIERKRHKFARESALRTYQDAKHNIAIAIIHASQKGGRDDLAADSATIDQILSIAGFKALFEGGRFGHEGFYAFQNQMSDHTPEFDEIVFNLKIVERALDRLVDEIHFDNNEAYQFFVRLDAIMRRIEHNGTGYDESKLLCQFIWEIFGGWNPIQGSLDYDPIERAIRTA